MAFRIGKPPRQDRSRKATRAFLRATLDGIEADGVEKLSMAKVAKRAGSSIGSLYFRFGDKSRLVSAAMDLAIDDLRRQSIALLDRADAERWPTPKVIESWVALLVDNVRERRNLVRELVRHTVATPESWNPIRDLRRSLDARLMTALKRGLGQTADRSWERRFRVGLQAFSGNLLHMVVVDPGPLRIDDQALKATLCDMLIRYVGLPSPRRGGKHRLGPNGKTTRMTPAVDKRGDAR